MERGPDICPHCGDTRAPVGERCRACGRSRNVTRRLPRWARLAVPLVCVVALGVFAVLLTGADDRSSQQSAKQRALVAKERARLVREQRPQHYSAARLKPTADATDRELLEARAALLRRAERSILLEARRRERAHRLDGPITGSYCRPISSDPESVPDDRVLTKRYGRYRCLAEIRDVPGTDGGVVAKFGHPWVAALDFKRFTYVICRDTPAQGERGAALVTVRLERECLAATGRAIGNGYADAPEQPLTR